MWRQFCALVVLCCFSCSSLQVASSPATSTEAGTSLQPSSNTEHLLKLIASLRQELDDLRLIFKTLKSSSQALSKLSDSFEQRLTALQGQLTQARLESSGLQQDLTKLKQEFEDYKKARDQAALRDGLIIGGVGLVVGVVAGLGLGKLFTPKP